MGRRTAAPARRGSAIAALAVLVCACLPIGIAEDYHEALVRIYNRTLTNISYESGWVPMCSKGVEGGLPPWPSGAAPAPRGSAPVRFDLGMPADYKGVISVIVSETGVEVIHGEVNERDLPEGAGRPPP
jgi:hypothetical protein